MIPRLNVEEYQTCRDVLEGIYTSIEQDFHISHRSQANFIDKYKEVIDISIRKKKQNLTIKKYSVVKNV